jgi:tape measure domain-containing protein
LVAPAGGAVVGAAQVLVGADTSDAVGAVAGLGGALSDALLGPLAPAKAALDDIMGQVSDITDQISSSLVQGGLNRALDLAEARSSLTFFVGDMEKVNELLEIARTNVVGTRYGFNEAATAANSFVGAGITGYAELNRMMGLAVDTAAVTDRDLGSIGKRLAAIADTGRVYWEDFRLLADVAPGFADELRDELGVTNDELRNLFRTGKVDSEVFFNALESHVYGFAQHTVSTVSGAEANVKAAFARIGASIFGPFVTEGGPLVTFLNAVTAEVDGLADEAQMLAEALGPAFDQVTQALLPLVSIMGEAFAEALIELAPLVADLITQFADFYATHGPALVSIVGNLMEMFVQWSEIMVQVAEILANSFLPLIEKATDVLATLGNGIKGTYSWFETFFDEMGQTFRGEFDAFIDKTEETADSTERMAARHADSMAWIDDATYSVTNSYIANLRAMDVEADAASVAQQNAIAYIESSFYSLQETSSVSAKVIIANYGQMALAASYAAAAMQEGIDPNLAAAYSKAAKAIYAQAPEYAKAIREARKSSGGARRGGGGGRPPSRAGKDAAKDVKEEARLTKAEIKDLYATIKDLFQSQELVRAGKKLKWKWDAEDFVSPEEVSQAIASAIEMAEAALEGASKKQKKRINALIDDLMGKDSAALMKLAEKREKVARRLEKARQALEDAIALRDDWRRSVTDQMNSFLSIMRVEEATAEDTVKGLQAAYDKQVAVVMDMRGELERLADLGVSNTTLNAILKREADEAQALADQIAEATAAAAKGVTTDVVAGMQANLDQAKKFWANIKRLRSMGLSEGALQELIMGGPEASAHIVEGLLAGGKDAIDAVNKIQEQSESLAEEMGKKTSKWFFQAGVDAAEGLVKGLESKEKALAKAMRKLAKAMVNEIKKELGIKSPSKVMADEVAGMMIAGGVEGIDDGIPTMQKAAARMGRAMVPSPGSWSAYGTPSGATVINLKVEATGARTREDGQAVGEGILDVLGKISMAGVTR